MKHPVLIHRDSAGLWLEMRLTLADYFICLDACERHAGALVKGSGIDFAPSNEFVGVCLNLDENDTALLEDFLDKLVVSLRNGSALGIVESY
jgi:hypothetical protein